MVAGAGTLARLAVEEGTATVAGTVDATQLLVGNGGDVATLNINGGGVSTITDQVILFGNTGTLDLSGGGGTLTAPLYRYAHPANVITGGNLLINGNSEFRGVARRQPFNYQQRYHRWGWRFAAREQWHSSSLTGSNSYGGGTTVRAGTVIGGSSAAFGSGDITINDGSTGANDTTLLLNEGVLLANNITVANAGTGTTTIGSNGGTAANGLPTFSGTLTLNKATTLQGIDTDRTTFSGEITGNVGTLTIDGGQRTVFSGASISFTGDVAIVNSSTLQVGLASGAVNQIPNASSVDVGAGSLFLLSTSAETINVLTGNGTVRPNAPSGGSTTFTIGAGDGSGTFDGLITNNGGQTLKLVKVGDGTQTLTNPLNSFTGGVDINGGVLSTPQLAGGNTVSAIGAALGFNSNLTFNDGTLQYTGGDVSINRPFTLNAGGGTIDVTNSGTTLTITDASGANNITGPGSLTKTGAGTLQIVDNAGAVNNYSGGTIVSQGTLISTGSTALGTGNVTLNDANTGANDTALLVTNEFRFHE